MTKSNKDGCVPGLQPKVLAVCRGDGTYSVPSGVSMAPVTEIEVTEDEARRLLHLDEPPRPHIKSKVERTLEKYHGSFGNEVCGPVAEAAERIRRTINDASAFRTETDGGEHE